MVRKKITWDVDVDDPCQEQEGNTNQHPALRFTKLETEVMLLMWFNMIYPKIDTWNTQKDPFNLLYTSVVKNIWDRDRKILCGPCMSNRNA